jgi:DNA-directed RNA polymerase specialized sigma24 family protein
VSPEDFARFLEQFSPDLEQAGRLYNALQKKLTDFFSMKGTSDPAGAADVALERAATKIKSGAVVPDVGKYCFGIARNLVKERIRTTWREHLAFQKFIEALSNSSAEQVERIYSLLKPCFDQLNVEEQQLLLAYCHEKHGRERAEYRRKLAERMKITVMALRIRVTRLRERLTGCIRERSNKG